jgi:hypothetical protein
MLSTQVVRELVLEHLREHFSGQGDHVVHGVFSLGFRRRLFPELVGGNISYESLGPSEREGFYLLVYQHLWQLLTQGVLVWGMNKSNPNYPFYRLTAYGVSVVATSKPQPYDPDGFLKEFDRQVPGADQVVRDYLEEAVRAFNANCFRSAAVMVGGASEKALLLLHEEFENQITDPTKKNAFQRDSAGISIHRQYKTLKDRLDKMVSARKFSNRDLNETIGSELPAGFELIRRCRNEAGHPELNGTADQDRVFLNLRTFIEYAKRVHALTDHFKAPNPADW